MSSIAGADLIAEAKDHAWTDGGAGHNIRALKHSPGLHMQIVCISDTHSRHDEMPPVPDGDVVVHAGDCTSDGSLAALSDFAHWFGLLPHRHKVLIAGNHDSSFEKDPTTSREICETNGVVYLQDETWTLDGLEFFGSPWTPAYRQMAFNADETEMFMRRSRIPDSTSILITHGPAWRVLDYVPRDAEHVGCFALARRIEQLSKLKAHICGHIHESYGSGVREHDGVIFVNASTCDRFYRPINPPITIDICAT